MLVCCPGNTHRNARHLVDDGLRCGNPHERRRRSIVAVDECLDLVEEAFRNIEAPDVLEAVQQPVGVGGIVARLELPDAPRPPVRRRRAARSFTATTGSARCCSIPLLDQLRLLSFEAFDAPHVPRVPLTRRSVRIVAVVLLARHTSRIGTRPPHLHTFSWIFSPRPANRRQMALKMFKTHYVYPVTTALLPLMGSVTDAQVAEVVGPVPTITSVTPRHR